MADNIQYLNRIADCYEEGGITHHEFANVFLRTATDDDVAVLFENTSEHLKAVVVRKALEYSPGMKTFAAGAYIIRNESDQKEFDRQRQLEDENYARGAKAVRKLIDDYCNKLWGKK